VSLSPSTTRPFDAPEFLFTVSFRHPARGHWFCPRVLYSLNPPFLAQTTPRFAVLQRERESENLAEPHSEQT
jgi:hypothetical protein